MKIAVISDLHLGRGDKADHFGHDDAEFLRFLDFLERNFERVVLLGDIYETLTCKRPGAQVAELAAVKAAHPEVVARFDRPTYRYIHGNHDIVTANVDGAPDSLFLNVEGTRVLFTHGHHFDWIIQKARWLSELVVWFGGWILRMGIKPVATLLDKFDGVITGVSANPERCRFQRWAVDLAKRKDADIVVTGHTHVGVAAEHGDRLFLNGGSCSNGRYSFISMDTRTGSYALNTGF